MARPRTLAVQVGDVRVANIERHRWNDLRCRYTPDAFERWPQNTPLLSCALPLAPGPLQATAFCRGLLSEGAALAAMAARAGVATDDTFGLLARYGRDVAGAMVIFDAESGLPPRRPGIERYSDDELADTVLTLEDNPLGIEDDSELSLAGIQNKLLLVRDGKRWARPTGGWPSTHILKIDSPYHPGLVEAEHACMRLAAAAGLHVAETELEQIGGRRCLIVKRFDRRSNGSATERIHQEDACQALGVDASAAKGKGKYEHSGGPRLQQIASLLDAFAGGGLEQMNELLIATVFNLLVGNADAHGKNMSLLHEPLGTTRLSPMYDVVPTVLWPALRTNAAMSVGGQLDIHTITRADVLREASGWGIPESLVADTVDQTCGRVVASLNEIAGWQSHLLEPLIEQVQAASHRLTAE